MLGGGQIWSQDWNTDNHVSSRPARNLFPRGWDREAQRGWAWVVGSWVLTGCCLEGTRIRFFFFNFLFFCYAKDPPPPTDLELKGRPGISARQVPPHRRLGSFSPLPPPSHPPPHLYCFSRDTSSLRRCYSCRRRKDTWPTARSRRSRMLHATLSGAMAGYRGSITTAGSSTPIGGVRFCLPSDWLEMEALMKTPPSRGCDWLMSQARPLTTLVRKGSLLFQGPSIRLAFWGSLVNTQETRN